MPAQELKQRPGRYNRQTAISRSRINQNANRSTSPYRSGSRGYQNRTAEYANPVRRRTAAERTYSPAVRQGGYQNTAADGYPNRGLRTAQNERTEVQKRPRNAATDMHRTAAVTVPVQMPIRRMTSEERAVAGQKAKARVHHIIWVAIIFVMCVFMIYRQTAIFGKNQEIEKLNSEYNGILVTNEGIQSSIDKSVELGNLESMAKNELGMVAPDSSQVFYIDMGNCDEVVSTGK